ncbi:MAG: hypothetical protein KJO21_08185 [Verrucomicrobiae bacterium]|nr:hypothetical protein [Verrucomicrobiae bacterium]NNJ43453.1 hypothetical protein [Akkermansiaceae bacterium]
MKRNTVIVVVALLVVVLVGAGGSYWAYKKYRNKPLQEYRYEGTLTLAKEVNNPEELKKRMMTDEILDDVIQDYDLVNRWGVADTDAVKARLREKFKVSVSGVTVKVSYQDRDKDLAQNLLKSLVQKLLTISLPAPQSGVSD